MKEHLNICVVTQQLGNIYSGPGIYSNILIQQLEKLGHKIHVLLPANQLPKNLNASYQTVPNPKLNSHAKWIELSFSFNQALKNNNTNFDLIHFTDFRDSFFVTSGFPVIGNVNDTYVTKRQSIKMMQKYYSDWFVRLLYYRLSRYVEKRKINSLDIIIANSQYTKNILIDNYPWINNKTFVCYKTIDFSQRISNQHVVSSYNILFVGGNMERKGLISIIKSSPIVINKLKNVQYHIIGQDPKIEEYKTICENLGVESNFTFYGYLPPEKRNELYKIGDLLLMPSFDEAFGIVFLEAMLNKIPVIGSNIGGIPELISHNISGILVNPNDIDEVSKQTISILLDQDLRNKFLKNSEKTLQKFTNEELIKCTLNLYSKIIS